MGEYSLEVRELTQAIVFGLARQFPGHTITHILPELSLSDERILLAETPPGRPPPALPFGFGDGREKQMPKP